MELSFIFPQSPAYLFTVITRDYGTYGNLQSSSSNVSFVRV